MTKDEFDAQLLRELSVAYTTLDKIQADLLRLAGEWDQHEMAHRQWRTQHNAQQHKLKLDRAEAQSRVDLLEDRVRKMLRGTVEAA